MTTLLGMAEILRFMQIFTLFDHFIRMPSRYYKILLPVFVFSAALLLCVVVGYKTLHKPQKATVASVQAATTASTTNTTVGTSVPSSLKTETPVSAPSSSPTIQRTSSTPSASPVAIPASYLQARMVVGGASYTLAFPSGSTLEAAMKLLESQNPPFTFTEHEYPGLGEFVDSLNGKANANGNYWFIYINGVDSPTGVTATTVHSGDLIEWRYEHQ